MIMVESKRMSEVLSKQSLASSFPSSALDHVRFL